MQRSHPIGWSYVIAGRIRFNDQIWRNNSWTFATKADLGNAAEYYISVIRTNSYINALQQTKMPTDVYQPASVELVPEECFDATAALKKWQDIKAKQKHDRKRYKVSEPEPVVGLFDANAALKRLEEFRAKQPKPD